MAESTSDRFVFSGKRGTLPLSDFIGFFEGAMRTASYRVAGFTQRTAFEFLGPYLRKDPLKLYNRELKEIMKLTEVVPAQPAVEGVAEQLEQHARPGCLRPGRRGDPASSSRNPLSAIHSTLCTSGCSTRM